MLLRMFWLGAERWKISPLSGVKLTVRKSSLKDCNVKVQAAAIGFSPWLVIERTVTFYFLVKRRLERIADARASYTRALALAWHETERHFHAKRLRKLN